MGARNECRDASDWNNDIPISFSRSSPCRRNTPSTYFLGLDVGKSEHHACALNRDGNKVFDKPSPQLESDLAGVFHQLQELGSVLVVVDQPNSIGALPITVARDCGCEVGYLPGLAMRKAADLYPGRVKTDKRDAFIIADTARTMPHTLRAVDRNDEVLSALKMLSGFDDDIARDCTRTVSRLRSILTQIYPSLERVFAGSTLTRAPILDLLIHYNGPQGLKRAGYQRMLNWMIKHTRKDPTPLVDEIFAALKAQTVTVLRSDASELVIPQLATNIKALKEQRNTIAEQVEEMLADFPFCEVLMSMPGVGIKTAAQILLVIDDGSDFGSVGHLAAYAGIAPVTRRSGSSIRGGFPARSGNKRLKTLCSIPFSPLSAAINRHGTTTNANVLKVNATTRRSSAWHDADATSSTRC